MIYAVHGLFFRVKMVDGRFDTENGRLGIKFWSDKVAF